MKDTRTILFYDTETTGLVNHKVEPSHPSQPNIIQLGYVLAEVTREAHVTLVEEINWMNTLIQSRDKDIHPKAQEAHGISKEKTDKYGVGIQAALKPFLCEIYNCDIAIAYNNSFDIRVILAELHRMSANKNIEFFQNHKHHCAMKPMTSECKIPSPWGHGYKWPSLAEAYRHCFGRDFEGAHDALVDVRATIEVYCWWLSKQERGVWTQG